MFYNVVPFLLSLPTTVRETEILFEIKIFDVEFLPDLYVLRSPGSKKVVYGNWPVCICACDSVVDI